MKWAAASSGGTDSWSLVNSGGTSLSGGTTTITGISNANRLMILFSGVSSTSASSQIFIRFNSDNANNYGQYGLNLQYASSYSAGNFGRLDSVPDKIRMGQTANNETSAMSGFCLVEGGNSSGQKIFTTAAGVDSGGGNNQIHRTLGGYWNNSATITAVHLIAEAGTFDSGIVWVYTTA